MPFFQKISRYSFVITILWFGFCVVIGFVETPLRFQPDRISTDEALSIGSLVFHALNTAEIIFATMLLLAFFVGRASSAKLKVVLLATVAILAAQTGLLFTVLDARVERILNGEEVPRASYHAIYIGLDILKLALLAALTTLQIRWFERSLASKS